jgi:hypothetical protein
MILAGLAAGCLLGCAQDSKPRPATEPEHRAALQQAPHEVGNGAPEPPRSVPATEPVPAQPPRSSEDPPAGVAAGQGPPPWWHERPRWEGTRVTVGASEAASSVLEARLSAVERGAMLLQNALGRPATQVEVTRVQVVPQGSGYRAYVLMVGE